MALLLNDRVKETTTTTGTGTVNLAGAIDGFETFVAGIGNGNTVYYAIVHQDNAEFEVGLGTVTDASPDTLSRSTIFSSSNSDGLVSFSSGTKDVFCTLPASKAIVKNDVNKVGINTNTPAQELHVVGNAFVSGQTFLGDASGDTVTLTGSLAHASHFTIDAGGDIHLDTGGQIKLDLNGTLFGNLFPSSGNLGIHVAQQDKDLIISGNDGGSGINALVIDMSDAGTATFNHDIKLGDNGRATFGDSQDLQIYHDATHSYIANFTNTLYLRTASTLQIEKSDGSEDLATFAVDGAVVLYHDGSSRFATDAEGANVTGVLDVSSKVAVAGGTEATSTDGSIRTEGGLSVAKKIFGGSDLTIDNGSISLTYDVSAGELNHAGATFHINKTNGVDVAIGNDDFYVDMSTNRIGIGNVSPDVSLDIGSRTDSIHVPVGTTAQRPGSPAAGYFRYNSTNGKFEGYSDQWNTIGSGTNMDTNIFTGDGSNTNFTLSTAPDTENNLIVFIDGVFQAQNVYSISGTTLTFATAPANGRVITAYHSTTTVGGSNNSIATMTGDGSDTTLTLSTAPVNENNVFVYFDGVYQSKSNYSISGTTLTFSTAPPSGVAVEAITATNTSITTATKLLDADGDTTIQVEESSDEDTIRFDIAGAEDFTMSANSFNVLSGSSASFADNSKAIFGTGDDLQIYHDGSNSFIQDAGTGGLYMPASGIFMRNAANSAGVAYFVDGGAVTLYYDGTAKLATTSTGVDVTGNLDATGAFIDSAENRGIKFDSTSVKPSNGSGGDADNHIDLGTSSTRFKNLYISGNIVQSSDLLLDAGGDIFLDADGGDIKFKDAGTTFIEITNSSTDAVIKSTVSDKDMIFKGNDGGSSITALTLDMSNNGRAVFNAGAGFFDHVNFSDNAQAVFGDGDDLKIYHDGSNSYINDSGTGNLRIGGTEVDILNPDSNEFKARFKTDGSVELYHNNAKKFETTSTGVDVTGVILSANNNTDDTNKEGHFLARQYDSGTETEGFQILQYFSNSSENRVDLGGASSAYNAATSVSFYTAANTTTRTGTERARIDSSGNIGIGTSSPSSLLHLGGSTNKGVEITSSTANAGYLAVFQDQAIFSINRDGSDGSFADTSKAAAVIKLNSAAADSNIEFQTTTTNNASPTTRLTIDKNGNVGIGTTSPAQKLDVSGHIKMTGSGTYMFGGDNEILAGQDSGGYYFATGNQQDVSKPIYIGDNASMTIFNTGNAERMRIDGAGNFMVGKTSYAVSGAGAVFYPDGQTYHTVNNSVAVNTLHVYDNVDSAYRFYVRATGSSAGTIFATVQAIASASDERLKENIKDLETGLTEIMALKPRRFDWKEGEGNGTKNNAGFIAQEVEPILPELVGDYLHKELDDVKSLTTGNLIPTLVKAIQEQQTLIEDLKTRIEVLEG